MSSIETPGAQHQRVGRRIARQRRADHQPRRVLVAGHVLERMHRGMKFARCDGGADFRDEGAALAAMNQQLAGLVAIARGLELDDLDIRVPAQPPTAAARCPRSGPAPWCSCACRSALKPPPPTLHSDNRVAIAATRNEIKTSRRRNANGRSRVRCNPPASRHTATLLYTRRSSERFTARCKFLQRGHDAFRFCPERRSDNRDERLREQDVAEIAIAMSMDVLIGDGEAARLTPHPLRAAILGEVHARPFTPIAVPSRIVHFAFDTSGSRAQADRANLLAFCTVARSAAAVAGRKTSPRAVRHHRAALGAAFGIHHLYLGNAGRSRPPHRSIPMRRRWRCRCGWCRSPDLCWSPSICICWPKTCRAPRRSACSTMPALPSPKIPMAPRSMPPISSPGLPASSASWSPTATCRRNAPARWCSA